MEPRPLVVTFANTNQKAIVLQRKKNIKHLQNIDSKPIFINDYLPAEMSERKCREKEIVFENENEPDNLLKVPMEVRKGKLFVQNVPYQKKVQVPDSNTTLNLRPAYRDSLLQIKTYRGKEVRMQGSIFVPYAAECTTLQQIQSAYTKLKLLHADARHIVCAYSIQGITKCYDQDYCDDQEVGAGRQLLKLLKTESITPIGIFVVRYYGGAKLGPSRFQCFVDAAKNVIIQMKPNFVWSSTKRNVLRNQFTSPRGTSIRARAGGRGGYINPRGRRKQLYNPPLPTRKVNYKDGELAQALPDQAFTFSKPLAVADDSWAKDTQHKDFWGTECNWNNTVAGNHVPRNSSID